MRGWKADAAATLSQPRNRPIQRAKTAQEIRDHSDVSVRSNLSTWENPRARAECRLYLGPYFPLSHPFRLMFFRGVPLLAVYMSSGVFISMPMSNGSLVAKASTCAVRVTLDLRGGCLLPYIML